MPSEFVLRKFPTVIPDSIVICYATSVRYTYRTPSQTLPSTLVRFTFNIIQATSNISLGRTRN